MLRVAHARHRERQVLRPARVGGARALLRRVVRLLREGRQHRRVQALGREQVGLVLVDEVGVQLGLREAPVVGQLAKEADVGGESCHSQLVQSSVERPQRARAVLAPHHQLGDHRVVEDADVVALLHARLHAHPPAHARGEARVLQPPRRRQEAALGLLRVDARLEGVPPDGQLALGERQALAHGHAQLPLHEVGAGDHLGDGVLHLQARVHLHEEELVRARVHDELHRARADVADGARGGDGGLADGLAEVRRDGGRRRLLDHLLVAPLHAAVALEEVHAPAVRVGEHLHLDVPRPLDVPLQDHLLVTERRLGFSARRRELRRELRGLVHDAHALAAAAKHRLDEHRVAHRGGLGGEARVGLVVAPVAGDDGHAGGVHEQLGGALAAHRLDRGRRRAHEDQPRARHLRREGRALGQEAVARVHRLRPRRLRRHHHRLPAQVALRRRRAADVEGLRGAAHVQGAAVGVGEDRHRGDAQRLRGGGDAARDLPAVGDQQRAQRPQPLRRARARAVSGGIAASERRAAMSPLGGSAGRGRRCRRSGERRRRRRRRARRRHRQHHLRRRPHGGGAGGGRARACRRGRCGAGRARA
mmetsp:Transcript_6174/g.22712  ORF Transcript_6174/g.22712 Transcript_6174/m.22712 type:complete len:591 (-) Transcript_6174:66-1838(-)